MTQNITQKGLQGHCRFPVVLFPSSAVGGNLTNICLPYFVLYISLLAPERQAILAIQAVPKMIEIFLQAIKTSGKY